MTLEEIQKQIEEYGKKTAPLQNYPTGAEFAETLRGRLTQPDDIKNIIQRIAESRSRMLAIPAETRAEMKPGLFSPTQVAGLVSQRQEPVRTQWETLMGVKQAREGKLEDIIGRATEGYKAQIEKEEKKYIQQRQKLQDLIEERDWLTRQGQYATEQAEEKRRWEAEMAKPGIFGSAEGGYYQQVYNPQTGKWEIQQAAGGITGPTGAADEITAYAMDLLADKISIGNVPQKIRGQVLTKKNELLTGQIEDDINIAISRRDYGTREDLIANLKAAYPEIDRGIIQERVYSMIPDVAVTTGVSAPAKATRAGEELKAAAPYFKESLKETITRPFQERNLIIKNFFQGLFGR